MVYSNEFISIDCLPAKKCFSKTKMFLWQMLYKSPFSTHLQVFQTNNFIFFHLEIEPCFCLDPGFRVTKAKKLNQHDANQREGRAVFVLFLGLQIHKPHGTPLLCSGWVFSLSRAVGLGMADSYFIS